MPKMRIYKIQQLQNGAFTVYVPKQWVIDSRLIRGDYIKITRKGDTLILEPLFKWEGHEQHATNLPVRNRRTGKAIEVKNRQEQTSGAITIDESDRAATADSGKKEGG